jgi:hypothetical protein
VPHLVTALQTTLPYSSTPAKLGIVPQIRGYTWVSSKDRYVSCSICSFTFSPLLLPPVKMIK